MLVNASYLNSHKITVVMRLVGGKIELGPVWFYGSWHGSAFLIASEFGGGECHSDLSSGANGYLIWPSVVLSPPAYGVCTIASKTLFNTYLR